MNRHDLQLQRLFEAARENDAALPNEMPVHLANRVMAHWRSGALMEDSWHMVVLLFRRALVCASVVILFTLAWSFDGLADDFENAEAYANYELRTDLMP